MKALHSISAIILCLISFVLITSSLVAEESNNECKESYKKIDNPREFMIPAFSKAKEENKKLITAASSADLASIEYPSYEALPWE